MSDLPVGWTSASLGELSLPVQKVDPLDLDRETFRYIDIGSIDGERQVVAEAVELPVTRAPARARQLVHGGDTLFSTVRPYLRKVSLVPRNLDNEIASTGFCVIRPHPAIEPKFLFYSVIADNFIQALLPKQRGVSYPAVRNSDIFEIPIAIAPPPEQRRIVSALDYCYSRLEAGYNACTGIERRIQSLRCVLLNVAVNGRLRAMDGRLAIARREHHTGKKRTPLELVPIPNYALPANWSMVSLGDLSYDYGYGTSTKCEYGAPGVPVLRIPNVQNGEVDLSDLKHAVDASLDLSKLFVAPTDLLFVRTNGSRDLIGRAAVVRESMEVAFASYLIRFRLLPDVSPDWVRVVVSSPLWRRHLENAAASSAGQYNLSARVLARLPIPMPDAKGQREILTKLDEWFSALESLEMATKKAEKHGDLLRRSLLVTAFAGRLVPQDPMDEPAIKLLARIREDRASSSMSRGRDKSRGNLKATVQKETLW